MLTILLALHHRREAKHTRAPTQNFDIIRLTRVRNENFVATFVVDIDKRFPSLEHALVVALVVFGDQSDASRGSKKPLLLSSLPVCYRQFLVVVVNCFPLWGLALLEEPYCVSPLCS